MVITVQSQTDRHELKLQGRLDANWADLVAQAIETAIRAGHHEVDLDFAEVNYISSAGIRVLLKYCRQLKAARGSLRVVRPTEAVLKVIRLSGLAEILLAPAPQPPSSVSRVPATPDAVQGERRHWQREGTDFESYELPSAATMEGRVLGRPEAFTSGELSAVESERLQCTVDTLAVGLGAFGLRLEDTQTRLGESLAVAGVAVTLPTDGSSVPDYQLTEGELVPDLQLVYGLVAQGMFSRLIRFEASRSQRGVIGLGDLVESILHELQSASAGFAIVAESASVVGALLKRSPALAEGQSVLAFPAVRDWLAFTSERTDERNLVLIAGMAERTPNTETARCLRPIGPGTQAQGHFHAAVFPYRPLPKGNLDLRETVTSVFGTESAQAVIHLLADERQFEGLGQTDFMRGACWAGPLHLQGRATQTVTPRID
jgi:anti-anti-sigma factor